MRSREIEIGHIKQFHSGNYWEGEKKLQALGLVCGAEGKNLNEMG